MIRRIFFVLVLVMIGVIFSDLALNYTERQELSPLAQRYAEQGPQELGAANLVTAVIVTYRGLDTLGEVTVLFISAAGVGLLLGRRKEDDVEVDGQEGDEEVKTASSELVETATEVLLPMVLLFGIYVFLNGHLTPGGGFQGGAIIASGTMLLLLALPQARISRLMLGFTESLSGFFYLMIGVLGVVLAGGFLDNRIMGLGTYGSLFSAGAIPLIYVFVGLKVGSELSAVIDRFRH